MNIWHLMLSVSFPLDVLVTLAVGFVAGFAWTMGARVGGKLL